MSKKPILTISLLASNRPDTIRRCLDSIRVIMEKIPSELILVDTSNNPFVHEILLEYTDKVYEFKWVNDFAKARNVGVSKATGEWLLFLDDDEWFVDVEEIVNFFQSGEYKKYGYANHRIRNFYDKNLETYSDAWVSRLVKLQEGACFHSKIHEYFAPIYGSVKKLNSLSYHSGYIFETEEELEAHARRNISLLEQMIEEEPANPRWQLQLAQEYFAKKDWEKLRVLAEEKLPLVKEGDSSCEAIGNTLLISYAESLLHLNQVEEALVAANDALHSARAEIFTQTFARLILAEIFYIKKDYSGAREYLKDYFEAYRKYASDVSLSEKYSDHLVSDDVFDDKRLNRACSLAILTDLKEGKTEALHRYYEGMKWGSAAIYIHRDTVKELVKCMAELPYDEMFSKAAEDLFKNKYGRAQAFIEIVKMDGDESAFDKLMYILSRAESTDWYIQYAKILVYGRESDWMKVEQAAKMMFADIPNVLLMPEDAERVLAAAGITETDYWRTVPFEKWQKHVDEFCRNASKEQLNSVKDKLFKAGLEQDVRAEYFLLKMDGNAKLIRDFYRRFYNDEIMRYAPFALPENLQVILGDMHSDNQREDIHELREGLVKMKKKADATIEEVAVSFDGLTLNEMATKLWIFKSVVLDYCRLLYRDEAFRSDVGILPAEGRAALALNRLFENEKKDIVEMFGWLKAAATEYVGLGENVKRIARAMKNMQPLTDEMHLMIRNIKPHVLQMVDGGMYKEALSSIKQIRMMEPFDGELIAWEQELTEYI